MNPKRAATFALVVLVLGAAGFFATRAVLGSRGTADFPDGIRMICDDPQCGRVFTSTLAEIARLRATNEDAPVPCPACGEPAARARECPNCHGSFAAERVERARDGSTACPLCHNALPHLAG
ncbi:MAG: hypothetical protein IPJ41_06875 [Phycisphaerales bacterium]|nr:hypothetical protein [Phycisphaerales bacterium]